MRLRLGACSDKGQVRHHNEDAFVCDPSLGLFIVCDGMGGEAAGEVASRMAIETMVRQLNGAENWQQGKATPTARGFQPATRQLESAIRLSNQAVYEDSRRNPERHGMGTTVVSAWIRDNLASLAHVGDSRAYLWRNQNLEQLTRDHSLVEEQLRAGLISHEESLASSQQNVLLRALGGEPEVEVELAELPLMPGDALLLCSDGLSRMVSEETMADTLARLQQPQEICRTLVDLANQNGGEDNITVVVAQVLPDSWWRRLWSFARR